MNRGQVNRPGARRLRGACKALLGQPLHGALEIDGADRLPRSPEPLVVVSNHSSYWDTFWYALAIEASFVVCGAKPRLFRTPFHRALMSFGNVLRVDDHEQFVGDCTALLRAGSVLLSYPEMGRNPSLGPLSAWPAEAALAADAPFLPCRIEPGPRIAVGHRIAPRGTADSLTREIRDALVALGAT